MTRRAQCWWSGAAVLFAMLATATFALLSMPAFGGKSSGARLARRQANSEFHDGHFVNAGPAASTVSGDLVAYAKGQFVRVAARVGKHALNARAVQLAARRSRGRSTSTLPITASAAPAKVAASAR